MLRLSAIICSVCVCASVAQANPQITVPSTGASFWKQVEGTTKDGRKVTQIQLHSMTPLITSTGDQIPIILAIECRGKESTAAIALKDTQLTARTRMTRLTMQTDSDKPRRIRFHRTANKRALLIENNRSAIGFVTGLMEKETLMVTAPFSQPKITGAIFKLGDLKNAVKPVSTACNWQGNAPR